MIDELKEFLSEVDSTSVLQSWNELIYLFAREFGWTQEDIESTDIPYILSIINVHKRVLKEEERALKKNGKRQ